jgi:cytochrome c oxidase subunit 2
VTTRRVTLLLLLLGISAAPPLVAGDEPVIHISVRRFEYTPAELTLKRGVPVVLELTSEDRHHGFNIPELKLRADVMPGAPVRVRLVPERTGRFTFHCDVFCGSGHEDMTGVIVVTE